MQPRQRRTHGRSGGDPSGMNVAVSSSLPGSSSDSFVSHVDPSKSCDNFQYNANAARVPRRAVRPPAPGGPWRGAVREQEAQSRPPGEPRCGGADDTTVRDLDGECSAQAAMDAVGDAEGAEEARQTARDKRRTLTVAMPVDACADVNDTYKRRRIRGKQPQWNRDREGDAEERSHAGSFVGTKAARGAGKQGVGANPPNSLHGTGSAGPSRSDSPTGDRVLLRRDRDGQELPVARLPSGNNGASGRSWQIGANATAMTAMRGRPPDADAPCGGCRGAS